MPLNDRTSFQSKHNEPAIAALVAIGKAHARYPGVKFRSSLELAQRLEPVLVGSSNATCVVALVTLLLKGLGVTDFSDASRFT